METNSPSTHGPAPSLRTTRPAAATAVVSSRARHGSTGWSAGRYASTAPDRSRSPPLSAPGCSSPFSSSTMERSGASGAHWASAVAEEKLTPTAGLEAHGRLGAFDADRRIGQVELAGRVRQVLEPDHRIGRHRSPRRCARPPSRPPASPGSVEHGSGRGAGCDRPEGGDHVGRRRQRGVGRIGAVAVANDQDRDDSDRDRSTAHREPRHAAIAVVAATASSQRYERKYPNTSTTSIDEPNVK